MTEKHVTYARRRLTSLVTAWRTGIAKAFERQYADQLHRRHRSASCSHLVAVARPRIGRGDATNPDMVAYFLRIAAFDSFVGDVVYNHNA